MFSYYKEALKRFIDLSTNDPASVLAKENALQGLATLLKCYKNNGLSYNNLYIVALPDFTYTRNKLRWNAGFSYGCILFLDQTTDPIIPLEARPNACGIIFSKISDWEENEVKFCDKILDVFSSYDEIDKGDFQKRNHFFAVYATEDKKNFYALLHGSFSKVKRDTDQRPGLYVDRSMYWQNNSHKISLGSENYHYLIGDKATQYYNLYTEHEQFSILYREKLFNDLFGEHQVLSNSTHEGFHDISTLLLGAYASEKMFETPLMLSPDSLLPLISISKTIEELTSGKVKKCLYCTPHGGGYQLEGVSDAAIAYRDEGKYHSPYFSLNFKGLSYNLYAKNIADLPFKYRKNTASVWCSDFGAGRIQKNLVPIFSTKI